MTAASKSMEVEAFLDWCLDQEGRWELVDGVPTLAMTGATRRHDTIVVNIIREVGNKLRGARCSVQTADQALRTAKRSVRRPDATIDCGPTADSALESSRPTVAFEVLSPSTRKTDRFRKLEEYKAVESLAHVALIDPDRPVVMFYNRRPDKTWDGEEIEGLDRTLEMTAVPVSLTLSEIYDGLTFAQDQS